MATVSSSLLGRNLYVPAVQVTVEGAPLPATVAHSIREVIVDERIDAPGSFSLQVHDPGMRLMDPNNGIFAEGREASIRLGYLPQLETLIEGEITALEPNFPQDGAPALTVRGFDFLHRLTRGAVTRVFSGLTLAQIFQKIASEMGLPEKADSVADLDKAVEYLAQSNVSNLDFLQERAGRLGLALWVENRTLRLGRRTATPGREPITLAWGKTLGSFQPRLTTAGQVEEVVVRAWDPVRGREIVGRARRNDLLTAALSSSGRQQAARGSGGRSQTAAIDRPVFSQAEADAMAAAVLSDITDSLITGSGSSIGRTEIRAGADINLTGVGRFSGTYQVVETTHTFGAGGYQTTFEVRKRIV